MSQLQFDAEAARRIEKLYLIRDAARRRALVRRALAATPGARLLDVGCDPGFYSLELLEDVGPSGSVVGVDSSPAMLALARKRCAGRDNVELLEGGHRIPVESTPSTAPSACRFSSTWRMFLQGWPSCTARSGQAHAQSFGTSIGRPCRSSRGIPD